MCIPLVDGALFHAAFRRLFGWPERLAPSGSLNTAITQTLNAMLIFVFLGLAAGVKVMLRSAADLTKAQAAAAAAGKEGK